MGENLGIGEGVFITKNNDGFVPTGVYFAVLWIADLAIATHGVCVERLG